MHPFLLLTSKNRSRIQANIHDELLLEVQNGHVAECVAALARVMGAAGGPGLSVPLPVSFQAGERWGSLSPLRVA